MLECDDREYYTGHVNNQEHNNKEDKHGSGSLVHGMQPSNHDDLHHLSAESISLRFCSSPPSMAVMTTFVTLVV
jgi:hypothetical protein